MGWASGSGLAETVWDEVRQHIPEEERRAVAKRIYALFVGHDADAWELCEDGLLADAGIAVPCNGCENVWIHQDDGECWDCEEQRRSY